MGGYNVLVYGVQATYHDYSLIMVHLNCTLEARIGHSVLNAPYSSHVQFKLELSRTHTPRAITPVSSSVGYLASCSR